MPKKPHIRGSNQLRIAEVIRMREWAHIVAEQRLRSGSIRSEENLDTNASSQIASDRIRDEERRYQESLRLPPILSAEDREKLNISNNNNNNNFTPSVYNNPSIMEPPIYHPRPNNPLANNSQNNSQGNNNSTSNNQANNNYTYNNYYNTSNSK
jgi:hypothetical protein